MHRTRKRLIAVALIAVCTKPVYIHDIESGDYVTLSRARFGRETRDVLLTFHDVFVEIWSPTYACYATPQESIEDRKEDFEE